MAEHLAEYSRILAEHGRIQQTTYLVPLQLLRIMDGRAGYCVYATNNRNSTIWFLFRVAPVLVNIRFMYHVHRARDLRETRICIINTTKRQSLTTNFNTAYVPLQVIFVHVNNASIPTIINT